MRVIRGRIGSLPFIGDALAITIGNFDGVHLGHQALIKETKKHNMKSVVFTFSPHPKSIINPNFKYNLLTPLHRKIDIIRDINPDYLFIIDFDQKSASMTKTDFVNWLLKLNVKIIVSGVDWHFGYKSEGHISDLKNYFKLITIPPILVDNNNKISSTYIKKLLEKGNIVSANKLLGRDYFIEGCVSKGKGLGTKFGFATANIDIFSNVPPKKGVYAIKAYTEGVLYLGMCNVGHNPTIAEDNPMTIEAHLFNFNSDIYNKEIVIYFLDFIRNEKKFASKEKLINQLGLDKKEILARFTK